jgi:hypothetical protein
MFTILKRSQNVNIKKTNKMNISTFLNKFTINPFIDIVPYFELKKRMETDAINHEGCFNCEDKINTTRLRSTSWTGVLYCGACRCLNVIYYQDRMSGTHTDVIEIYSEKSH